MSLSHPDRARNRVPDVSLNRFLKVCPQFGKHNWGTQIVSLVVSLNVSLNMSLKFGGDDWGT